MIPAATRKPQPRAYRESRTSRKGGGWLLVAIALLVVGGFTWYGTRDKTNTAASNQPTVTSPNTSGAATGPAEGIPMDKGTGTNPPAANTPTVDTLVTRSLCQPGSVRSCVHVILE